MLAETFGFSDVFFLTGGLLVLASIIVMIFVHEPHQPRVDVTKRKKGTFMQLKPLFSIFIASTITQVGLMSIEPIVSIYAKTLYTGAHLATIAGLVVAMSGIANLIGAPTLGRLVDRKKGRLNISLLISYKYLLSLAQTETCIFYNILSVK